MAGRCPRSARRFVEDRHLGLEARLGRLDAVRRLDLLERPVGQRLDPPAEVALDRVVSRPKLQEGYRSR